jgi:hypothetical protein
MRIVEGVKPPAALLEPSVAEQIRRKALALRPGEWMCAIFESKAELERGRIGVLHLNKAQYRKMLPAGHMVVTRLDVGHRLWVGLEPRPEKGAKR